MNWRPMSENGFPWEHTDVIIAAYDKEDTEVIEIFRCTCAEHGAYFTKNGGMQSLIELGWIPFAWQVDDIPVLGDPKFEPMLTDYLTENA